LNRRRLTCLLLFICVILPPGLAFAEPSDASLKTIFETAQQALLLHDYKRAEAGFQKYLKEDPHSVPALSNLGVVYLRLGDYDSAITAFKKAQAMAPGIPQLDLNLGLAYYRKQEFGKAAPEFYGY